jgi:hypothetical protein
VYKARMGQFSLSGNVGKTVDRGFAKVALLLDQ